MASKPQGSSERVLPWQVTMDQLICASLSHTHYWYEVRMLKVMANTFISVEGSRYYLLMHAAFFSAMIVCEVFREVF